VGRARRFFGCGTQKTKNSLLPITNTELSPNFVPLKRLWQTLPHKLIKFLSNMRYYHLKTFFLLAILSLYSSCGYEIPGKDKHPEIPEFNGFDKDLFVIDTLLTEVQLMGT